MKPPFGNPNEGLNLLFLLEAVQKAIFLRSLGEDYFVPTDNSDGDIGLTPSFLAGDSNGRFGASNWLANVLPFEFFAQHEWLMLRFVGWLAFRHFSRRSFCNFAGFAATTGGRAMCVHYSDLLVSVVKGCGVRCQFLVYSDLV